MGTPLREKLGSVPTSLYVRTMNRALHAFARVRYAMPDARPSRFQLRLERDLVYGSRDVPEHRLDAYIPTHARTPTPVVMYVHGGGFRMLSKDTHRVMALAIARAGYLLFNINYRLGPRHRYPAPLEDASRALLWVKESCARYGGDPSRIALAGESAGGNLVTALAVETSWRRPEGFARRVFDADIGLRAVIATYGFLDLGHTDEYLKHPRMSAWTKRLLLDAARSYVGRDVGSAAKAFPLTSPLRIIEGGAPERPLPPFFASVGTRDPLLRCSKRLKAALDRLGTECELHLSPGEIHGYDAMVWRPRARAKWVAAAAFLDRHLAASRRDDGEDVRAAV
ncbi:MAG: alpha/beta hydrolase [Polyangiaceae bacterium]|jgi:acetyl esterase